MARSRNIKPGFAKNEFLAQLGFDARLLFALLPTIADRAGRIEDRPMRIKGELFPYEQVDVDELLRSLATPVSEEQDHPFIVRYQVDGRKYIQITKFSENQNPHKEEKDSEIPPPLEHDADDAQEPDAHHTPTAVPQDCGLKESGTSSSNRKKKKDGAARFPEFWDAVPRKVDKGRAEKAYAKAVRELADREEDAEGFLIERMLAFAKSPKGQGEFCPYPGTWLNGQRYDDDPRAWEDNAKNKTEAGQHYDPTAPKEEPRIGL